MSPPSGATPRHPRSRAGVLGGLALALLLVVTSIGPLVLTNAAPAPTSGRLDPAIPPLAAPPRVQVTVNPAFLVLGNMSKFTGSVAGGTPSFTYNWTALPPGCASSNRSILDCTPTEAGVFTIKLVVTDSLNRTGSNTTHIQVNITSTTTSGGGGIPPSETYLFAGLMGTAAAVATAALFILYWRRRRRKAPPVPFSPTPYVPPHELEQP